MNRKRKVLLCPPDFYTIEYEINPWMDRRRPVDRALAQDQWKFFRDTLYRVGCEIEFVTPRPELPDMVFAANAGLVVGCKYIRSNYRFDERAGEAGHFHRWFVDHEFEVVEIPAGLKFEGEGDALFCGDTLFLGYRFRSDFDVRLELEQVLGCKVIPVELSDRRFYHLDTCFCPIGEDVAIWFPAAFTDEAQKKLRNECNQLIEISSDEALRFGCNSVAVGNQILIPENCDEISRELVQRGYDCHSIPMSEFIKAGGACKCLVLFLE